MEKLVVLQCHLCAGRIDKDSLVCENCGYAYKLVDEAIIENLKNSYYDGLETTILNNELNYTKNLIKKAFYFYDIDPKYTKKLLTLLLDLRKKYPDSFSNWEEDDITKINVTWNGKSYTHKTFDDCIKNFINII